MKGTLKVSNFLIVNHAELELNDITIIIGPQANGKSIIAKLVYYFNAISDDFLEGIRTQAGKRELDSNLIERFENYFPRYAWDGSSFDIAFSCDDININIHGEAGNNGRTKLKINYCDSLVRFYRSRKQGFKKILDELDPEASGYLRYKVSERGLFREFSHQLNGDDEFSGFFNEAAFIPASRSFFANLQRNIFTFLASNIDIDPFLKEFGGVYEFSKSFYRSSFSKKHRNSSSNVARIERYISDVVRGSYEYIDEKDWIVSKSHRINVANASSGQQEALPMLLTMLTWPRRSKGKGSRLFVEEPEAHLFPTAQSKVVAILSNLNVKYSTGFFITTHSPYVLSAVNSLIMAHDAISSGHVDKSDFQNKFDLGEPLNFDNISAYTINKGNLVSIRDEEYRIIGAEILDNVAETLDEATSYLLERTPLSQNDEEES